MRLYPLLGDLRRFGWNLVGRHVPRGNVFGVRLPLIHFASRIDERARKKRARSQKEARHIKKWGEDGGAYHDSPILFCFAQLDFFQLQLLRALRMALPTRRTLLFQFCIVLREPDVRDEFMKLGTESTRRIMNPRVCVEEILSN